MVKIKTIKKLNLPQLIEYAWENDVKGKTFYASEIRTKNVYFNTSARAEFSSVHHFSSNDYFTVEVEEEITEDTWFPQLVIRTVKGHYGLWKKGSINDFKHITFNDVDAIYIPNDDLTMTLIWTREKGLVE